MNIKDRKLSIEDINVKVAIAFGIAMTVFLLLYIAFLK